MSSIPKPTEAELQILQVLWDHGPAPVRFINEKINEQKEVGYTTTLKLMQIMTEKGILLRDTSQKTHIYRAAYKKEETQKSLLSSFIKGAFQGSTAKLIMQALGNHRASTEELEEIKRLIDQIEQSKK